MAEEESRSHRRTLKNIGRIVEVWGPLEVALPHDLNPPRISFHLSRYLLQLAYRITLDRAIKALRKEIQSRRIRHTWRGRPATYITLSDVRAILERPSPTPSPPPSAYRIEVLVPTLTAEARRAYLPAPLPPKNETSPAPRTGYIDP